MEKIEKFNQIIDEVGQEYTKWFYDNAVPSVSGKPILNGEGILTRGDFINKCKTDTEFSEKWGLHIEERELSLEERHQISLSRIGHNGIVDRDNMSWHETYNKTRIPTKIITLTHNNETIASYE